jgi:hypothetical protein
MKFHISVSMHTASRPTETLFPWQWLRAAKQPSAVPWRYLTGRKTAHVALEMTTPVGPFVWFMKTSSR